MTADPVWGPIPDAVRRLTSGPGIWGIYGPPGCGKSTDQCRSFPDGLWIGVEGDFRSAAAELGIIGKMETGAFTIMSGEMALMKVLEKHFPGNKNPNRIPSVVIDELNTILGREVEHLSKIIKHGPAVYKQLGETLNRLFDRFAKLTEAGVHVAWNAHTVRPDFEETKRGEETIKGLLEREGGPEMPGQSMRIAAKRSHVLYRIAIDPGKFNNPHPYVYVADHKTGGGDAGANFYQKTRGFAETGPLNLAEILRAGGVQIRRPAAFHDWLEARVAWAAGPTFSDTSAASMALLQELTQQQAPDHVILWGLSDLTARREIAKSNNLASRLMSRFGVNLPG